MKDNTSISIVILNWNGKNYLEKFLPSVIASTYQNKKIIVADNASTDDSILFLQKYYPQIEIIINKTNEGFAKGYNTALQQITTKYIVLLNNDVEVKPNWIEPIISLMETDKNIGVCQPKILSFHEKNKFEYAGASGGWIDKYGYPFCRGRVFYFCEEDNDQYNLAQPCFWATGAAMFVNTNVFKQVGGLDNYFFAHQEEIDFCWRVQLAGYSIYCEPKSVVYHVGGGTLPKGNNRKTLLNFRNNLIMLAKNLSFEKGVSIIFIRLILDGISACKELLQGDVGYFFAVIKAHFGFWNWLLFNKKKSIFPVQKNGKLFGKINKSIVWAYFIQKKKTFLKIMN